MQTATAAMIVIPRRRQTGLSTSGWLAATSPLRSRDRLIMDSNREAP